MEEMTTHSFSRNKKRIRDDDERDDDSSQDSSSSIASDGKGLNRSSEEKSFTKKRDSLRIEELKRDWAHLLEECRDHPNALDAKSKRAEWLQTVESIYDEFSTLGKRV
jgi:hypothetical protein